MSFLRASWENLVLVNYIIEPKVLSPYIPKGTELDLWNGKCYVSLVGFLFKNTKLLGLKIPFHVNFEGVNLRFYVKRKPLTLISLHRRLCAKCPPNSPKLLVGHTEAQGLVHVSNLSMANFAPPLANLSLW